MVTRKIFVGIIFILSLFFPSMNFADQNNMVDSNIEAGFETPFQIAQTFPVKEMSYSEKQKRRRFIGLNLKDHYNFAKIGTITCFSGVGMQLLAIPVLRMEADAGKDGTIAFSLVLGGLVLSAIGPVISASGATSAFRDASMADDPQVKHKAWRYYALGWAALWAGSSCLALDRMNHH